MGWKLISTMKGKLVGWKTQVEDMHCFPTQCYHLMLSCVYFTAHKEFQFFIKKLLGDSFQWLVTPYQITRWMSNLFYFKSEQFKVYQQCCIITQTQDSTYIQITKPYHCIYHLSEPNMDILHTQKRTLTQHTCIHITEERDMELLNG